MNLVDREKCFTCGACVAICPKNAIKVAAIEGFYYPFIDKSLCVNCGLCQKVCPALKPGINNKKSKHRLFAFKHFDNDIIMQSSSGAAFTALSDIILSRSGAVVGAVMDEGFKVHHIVAQNKKDRDRMRRSKYVQSDVYSIYSEVIEKISSDQWILFTGTSCQVDAFRSYCENKNLSLKNIVLCALLCHGSASPIIWKDFILNFQQKQKIGSAVINFRDKSQGWRKNKFTAITSTETHDLNVYSSLYFSNLCNRKSCFSCPYTTVYRYFDITIGDFWTIKDYDPDYLGEEDISMLISHSEKGNMMIRLCEEYGELKELYFNPASHNLQRVLMSPYEKPIEYEHFWHDYKQKGIDYVVKKYVGMNFSDRLLRWIRRKALSCGIWQPKKN